MTKFDEMVEEAKKHKDSEDKEELEAAQKALNDTIMPIGAKMYEAAAKDEAPAEGEEPKADEPVEGEVVEETKEEDKK